MPLTRARTTLVTYARVSELSGGRGNDNLRSYVPDGSQVALVGDEGDDCLYYAPQGTTPRYYDCGPGQDFSSGVLGRSCETLTTACLGAPPIPFPH
jgi:hypothetical protein